VNNDGGLLYSTKAVKNIEEAVATQKYCLIFHRHHPLMELHDEKFNCRRFELMSDGWHAWRIPCVNQHLTTIEPKYPMGLN